MDTVIYALGNWVLTNIPIAGTIFGILGTILTIVSALDKILPQFKFSKKLQPLFDVPILGGIMNYLLRFSLVRNKKPGEP